MFKVTLKYFLALFLISFGFGCSTSNTNPPDTVAESQIQSQNQASSASSPGSVLEAAALSFSPEADLANLYVIRENSASPRAYDIYANNCLIGQLEDQTYLFTKIYPGNYDIGVLSRNISVKIGPGKNYFIRVRPARSGSTEVELLPEEEGRAEVVKGKLSYSSMVLNESLINNDALKFGVFGRPVDEETYDIRMKSMIQDKWKALVEQSKLEIAAGSGVNVTFFLFPEGVVRDVRASGSTNRNLLQLTQAAVVTCAPYPAFPSGLREKYPKGRQCSLRFAY